MKRSGIKCFVTLLILMGFFVGKNAQAAASSLDEPTLRPASHCTIHLLRNLFAKEISQEKTALGTNFDAIALYSFLKKSIMPANQRLYVSLVLGISLGNGFKQGICADLKTTIKDNNVMLDVLGDALGYVRTGFALTTASLYAPAILESDAQAHVDTINALANGAKKLQTFSVLPPPTATPYKADLREMVQQEYQHIATGTKSVNSMYKLLLQVGSERSADKIRVSINDILPLLHFTCRFPQYEPPLQARIINDFLEWERIGGTWSSAIIDKFTTYSDSNTVIPYLTAEEKRKADEQERRAQVARAMEASRRDEEERRQRFKPNGYPKIAHRFPVDLSTIYSAADMQLWMCSNGLSEESNSMMIVEKIGDLFKREKMGEEEFVKRTIAALLGRGKKNIMAFDGYRWKSLRGGTIAGEAFNRIEGVLRFKESDIAEDSFILNRLHHIQNLNIMLEDAGVPAPDAMEASGAAVVDRAAAVAVPVVGRVAAAPTVGKVAVAAVPVEGAAVLNPEEDVLLQQAFEQGWDDARLLLEIGKQKRVAALKATIIAARPARPA